jgi:uncharacterized protein YggE
MPATRRAWPLVISLLLLPAAPLVAAETPEQSRRTISVTGKGEVKAVPDHVAVSFAVETTAPRAAEAAAENARRSAAVTSALRAALGSGATVTTTRYAIEPRYEAARPGESREPRITGYIVRNQVQVESGQVDRVGGLIDAAIGAGANRIGALEFTLAEEAAPLRAALEKAGADAHAQAESAAHGLGVRLKGVLSATTSAMPVPRRYETRALAAETRAAPTPIEPGEATVSATLQVTYEIE